MSNQGIPVIAIASGKGGVGKTSISTNIGTALAAQGLRTLLLDADLGLANVDVQLGLRTDKNIAGVVRGQWSLPEVLVEGPKGLKVAPASSGIKRMTELTAFEHAGIINAFGELAGEVDIMLVDTGAGIGDNVIVYARAAQDVVVVVNDEPASITDAYALIKVLHRDYQVERFHILANRVESEEHGEHLYKQLLKVLEKFLNLTPKFLGSVPEDRYLKKSIQAQRAVVEAFPVSKSARALKRMANDITKWKRPEGASGFLEFFVEQNAGGHSDDVTHINPATNPDQAETQTQHAAMGGAR
ncbi:MAG: MinD/ParA family protein [Gammaproteobacteria bacterium]